MAFNAWSLAASMLGKQIEIISADQLSEQEAELIPASWLEIAGRSGREAVEVTLSLWRRAIPGRLPELLGILARCGYAIRLARVTWEPEPKPSIVLLYVFHDPDAFAKNFQMRIGFPPRSRENLPDYWDRFPDGIRSLYHEVHDGFLTNLWSGPAGLIRSNEMCRLGDTFDQSDFAYLVRDERGNVVRDSAERPVAPPSIPNLDGLVEVCKNYGSARLLIDTSTTERDAWEVWGGELEYWPNLWERLDDWLLTAFTADGYKPPA